MELLYYDTLFFDLRQAITAVVQTAKNADKGIWQDDATNKSVAWGGASSLDILPPIFPKLWRRLEAYTQDRDFRDDSDTLDKFLDYLVSKRSERVLILSEGRFTGFDNVIEVENNTIKMLYSPEDLVFIS